MYQIDEGTERWRERVPDFRDCNAEAASAK